MKTQMQAILNGHTLYWDSKNQRYITSKFKMGCYGWIKVFKI